MKRTWFDKVVDFYEEWRVVILFAFFFGLPLFMLSLYFMRLIHVLQSYVG